MRAKNPILLTVIGDLNIVSALFIAVSFFPTPKFIEQSGFSFIPIHSISEGIIRILEVISLLIIAYGFLRLKKWGYWLMITYNLFFLAASIVSVLSHNEQFASFFIPSLLALQITFPSKRYFIGENQPS
jgi:uncharacterized membrane protein (DUF2068 family)